MKTFLNIICVIVLMLSPLAFNSNLIKNHKSKIASSQINDNCEYYKIHVDKNDRTCLMYLGTFNNVRFMDCFDTTYTDYMLWRFINNIDGTVKIVSKVHDQQYMEITSFRVSSHVTTGSPIEHNRQNWYMRTSEGLTYFQNANNNLCMSYFHSMYTNYVALNYCSNSKGSNELFRLSCGIYKPVFTPDANDCSNKWFQIVNRGNNMCVKIENIKNRVVQGTCGNGDEFFWRLQALDDGHYMIYSKKGNYVLESQNHGIHNGNPVWNWDAHRGVNQRIEIKRSKPNPSFFNLIFKHSKRCLDVPGHSKQENIGLAQYDCIEGNSAEEFRFTCPSVFIPNANDCSNKWTQIVNRGNNMCVKLENIKNRVVQGTCGNGDEFLWRLEALDDGHYMIYSKRGNYVLESQNHGIHNGNPVWNWDPHRGVNQRIEIKRSNPNPSFFNLIFKHSKRCLDVPNSSKQENIGLAQHDCIEGNSAEEFRFICSLNFIPNANDCSNKWTQIVNRGNNMCVKLENIKNRVVQGTCGNGDEFLWRFEALDDGHYMIYSKRGNYVLESQNFGKDNGNPVWNWDPHRGVNQRIEIKRSNPNPSFFNLIFKHSKRCLDVPNGSNRENEGLAQHDCIEGNSAEEFKFNCPKV